MSLQKYAVNGMKPDELRGPLKRRELPRPAGVMLTSMQWRKLTRWKG
jgi:hypothetical protein